VTIHASVLKVDPRLAVGAHNDLKLAKHQPSTLHASVISRPIPTHLVIPPIRACPDLDPSVQLISSAKEVGAHLAQVLGLVVVQTYYEQCRLDHRKRLCIRFVGGDELVSQSGPYLPRLGGQDP
jgi:hypothetical protein